MELIKLYVMGFTILIIAILANFLATQLGLKTWYDFLNQWDNGDALSLKDGLWLFVLYPLILGCSFLIGNMLWKSIF